MVVIDESDCRHVGLLTQIGHRLISPARLAFGCSRRGGSVTGLDKNRGFRFAPGAMSSRSRKGFGALCAGARKFLHYLHIATQFSVAFRSPC